MAKKKTGPINPFKGMENMFSQFSPEEAEQALKILEELAAAPSAYEDSLNQKFYAYNRPDYAAQCKPVCEALLPIYSAQHPREVLNALHAALPAIEEMGAERRDAEVRNYLLNILADAPEHLKDKEKSCMNLYGIFALMEQSGITAATDLLIELLRQDMYFYNYYFSGFDDVAALAYSKVFARSMPQLQAFLLEAGRIPEMKWIALDAITHRADIHPDTRLEAVSLLIKLLGKLTEQDVYELTLERLVYNLCRLQAKEALPLIESACKQYKLPGLLIDGGMKGVKELMKHGCAAIEEIKDNDVEEFLEKVATYEEEHPDGEDDDEAFPNDIPPFFCGKDSGYDNFDDDFDDDCPSWITGTDNVKDYHLRVTLKDSPIPVMRELAVPSTIEMGVFETMLTMAMGWEGRHISSFKTKEGHYIREEYMDDDFANIYEPLDDMALNELLVRKGSSMTWEYDFGDSWMHEIKVIAATPHPKDEPYRVTLTAAEGACPPEDCGGVWGYANLLEVLADKKHPDYKMMKQWTPRGFKPDKANLTAIQQNIDLYLGDYDY